VLGLSWRRSLIYCRSPRSRAESTPSILSRSRRASFRDDEFFIVANLGYLFVRQDREACEAGENRAYALVTWCDILCGSS
jgi:hypothetical protein